jgi:hypothetical protein
VSRYRFIEVEKAQHSVAQWCRVLQVAPSGYYAWRHRQPSRRAVANAALTEEIRAIHEQSRAPMVHRVSTPTCALESSACRVNGLLD